MEATAGVIATEGDITVSAVVAVRAPPHEACIVLEPDAMPAASPLLAIVATPVIDEVHVTEFVTSSELLKMIYNHLYFKDFFAPFVRVIFHWYIYSAASMKSLANLPGMRKVNSMYWFCQVAGWGMVGIIMLFFAHAYQVTISNGVLLGRMMVVCGAGLVVTHLLRMFIKWRGWIMQSVEKVIPKLILAVIITSLVFSLLVLGLNPLFNLGVEGGKKLSFLAKLTTTAAIIFMITSFFLAIISSKKSSIMETVTPPAQTQQAPVQLPPPGQQPAAPAQK